MTTPAPASASFLVQNYNRQDVRFIRGAGCHLFDEHGRKYLDAFAGVAVSALGHAHPRLVAAISQQAGQLLHASNHYGILQQEALAKTIVQSGFPGRVLFCNSGTEANECAYKVVRLWGNVAHGGAKTRIIAFENGFHGRTIGSLSITASAKYREPFAPMPACEFLPFGDADALERAMGADVAGVFLEPIQGEGGIMVPPAGFLARARELCTRHGALLVVDEIQTGVGRTGRMYAHQHDAVVPDIMTLAKGLGGGVPIGAAVLGTSCADLLKPGLHGTTFGGNPLACAAAITVLDEVLTPGFLARVTERGDQLKQGLEKLFAGSAVRGKGLLLGVQLPGDPAPLVKAALAEGLVVGPSGNNTLRLAPPLIISEAEVDDVIAKLRLARIRT
ncbi:MAG: aspartate aminotransferase family protein [Planctomycetes bacterium]|nr:aspartate aminotransferase family protein [Planctomycetota bacterium]